MSTHLRPEESQLIKDQHWLSKTSLKIVRSTVYNAPSDPSISVRSWKLNEFNRELQCGDDSKGEPKYQIVARGYDKFFNIGGPVDRYEGKNGKSSGKDNVLTADVKAFGVA
ncbi:hypothetical protein DFJ58DRAFT_916430 [Suillus subalutaceus]|uniref:uncharacterized protein n=1 Tax=Suillus subalutaceus TaxID=48586 RepID=UPI001B86D68F|nr:uncharacterized protein DFJ58DRAFT_916430 [Suillus subalutaceus]KAG1841528.1 hypothetical protein DFJ58DRAFT_916430 [Suillus subalutaceus]